MGQKYSRSVNDFETVKIDVLEARDYVECIKCTTTFLIRQKDVDFRACYENCKKTSHKTRMCRIIPSVTMFSIGRVVVEK